MIEVVKKTKPLPGLKRCCLAVIEVVKKTTGTTRPALSGVQLCKAARVPGRLRGWWQTEVANGVAFHLPTAKCQAASVSQSVHIWYVGASGTNHSNRMVQYHSNAHERTHARGFLPGPLPPFLDSFSHDNHESCTESHVHDFS